MSKVSELRKQDLKKLNNRLVELRKELAEKKLMSYVGKDKDTSIFKKTRKEIARILTIKKEKEILNEQ